MLCGVVWADRVPFPVRHAEAQREVSSFLHWYHNTKDVRFYALPALWLNFGSVLHSFPSGPLKRITA